MRKYHYINLFAEYFFSPKTLYFERDTFNLTEGIKKMSSVSKKNYFYYNHETKSHGTYNNRSEVHFSSAFIDLNLCTKSRRG